MVAFAKRDALAAGYGRAVQAAAAEGFGAVLRLAGGRAAVFHDGTLEVAHAAPDEDARARASTSASPPTAALIARALAGLGVDARVGEVRGEYCPGRWSVNASGRRKLVGIGQRVVAGGSHTGSVIVVSDATRMRRVLEPVYSALVARLGSGDGGSGRGRGARDHLGGGQGRPARRVRDGCYELVPGTVDEETLDARAASSPPSTGRLAGP